jgi:hypothetical protein
MTDWSAAIHRRLVRRNSFAELEKSDRLSFHCVRINAPIKGGDESPHFQLILAGATP